ncbi:MAG: zinc ribbon domain-containing protein [Actinomycetota bacterium]
MNEAVTALLDLQGIDIARDRLQERRENLPERTELSDLGGRMSEIQAEMGRLQSDADTLEREERWVEEEVRLIEEKIAQEEHKMYSGQVINPKELVALQDEVGMLQRRKAPLEEKGLEELEARDRLLSERTMLAEQLSALEAEAAAVRARIVEAEGGIDRELGAEQDRRADVLAKIPAEALELYEGLRDSKRGIGVGALENGVCTACREALSAVEIDRIKRKARDGEWLFRCEHCRRLLVMR